jgi:hypothetical protein
LKVTLTNISDNYLNDYVLKKEIDNGFVKETVNTDLFYFKDDAKYLTESAIRGDDKETGTISKECGLLTFEKDIFIKHNEGKFNLKNCSAEKKLTFANPLDCVANGEINIFDYAGSEVKTIQGVLGSLVYGDVKDKYIGNYLSVFTLDEILSFMGGVPDKSSLGYFVEYIRLSVFAEIETKNDPTYGNYDLYTGHKIELYVKYIRITDVIKHSDLWLPLPISEGVGFYFIGIPGYDWKAPIYSEITTFEIGTTDTYSNTVFEAGSNNVYKDIPISNTFAINEIIEDLFTCSGMVPISNFFGINPDATEPDNKYYDFATNFCHQIKIAQSFDIIRESAIEDSFGKSGTIKVKDFFSEIIKPFNLLIVPDFENDIVRIEHVSYFITKGIDLVDVDYEFSDLEMNKEKIDNETFSFAQPSPTDGFYEVKLEYENLDLYTEPNDIQYKNKTFMTDVFGTLNNKDYEGDGYKKLFYLLSTDGTSIIGLNSSFSIKNLVLNLHDLNRPMKNALIKGVKQTFGGYSIGLEGEIKFVSNPFQWDVLWPLMSVKTVYGTYLIDEIEFNQDGEMTLKIKK